MVDALLIAAQSEDSDYMENDQDDVPQIEKHSQQQQRICEFCGSSNTPTWRRGPAGKGSLCNACGIKWRLRKRTKKGEPGSGAPEKKIKTTKASPLSNSRKKKEKGERPVEVEPINTTTSTTTTSTTTRKPLTEDKAHSNGGEEKIDNERESNARKNYYCKYCNKTWDFTHFKNSQQFGAHCSNCSRRPRQEDDVTYNKYYNENTAPTNLILILRYLQDELSDLEGDENPIPPSSPQTTPIIHSSSPPSAVPQLMDHTHTTITNNSNNRTSSTSLPTLPPISSLVAPLGFEPSARPRFY